MWATNSMKTDKARGDWEHWSGRLPWGELWRVEGQGEDSLGGRGHCSFQEAEADGNVEEDVTGYPDGGGLYGVKPVDPGILYTMLLGQEALFLFIYSHTELFFYFPNQF